MRYFFHIGFNGTHYRGWQKQPGILSIQEVIEDKLSQVLKSRFHIVGCGRTDAQVHAIQYFFHVDIEKDWDFDLLFRLNKILPNDIAIFEIIPMQGIPNAQLAVRERTYTYYIHTYKDPFLSDLSALYLGNNLHLDKMKNAADLLTRYTDFRAFCKSPDDYEHTICKVSSARLFYCQNGEKLKFQITSNRFLNRMIRIIVAKLLETGIGEFTIEEFEGHLKSGIPPKKLKPAYPQGLYLSKVTYPFLDIPPRTEFFTILQNNPENYWLDI